MSLPLQEFENLVQEIFDSLPERFQENMENVRIVVEDEPRRETMEKMGIRSPNVLLGLYEGIPLNKRGGWYGMSPAVPDKISLYKKNIERNAKSPLDVYEIIRRVLIHEIAHYYGLNEEEVRAAGF